MPKKSRSSRRHAVRKVPVQPAQAPLSETPLTESETELVPAVKTPPPAAAAPRRGQPSLDLSYVTGDLRRILILAIVVIVLLVVLSLVLR